MIKLATLLINFYQSFISIVLKNVLGTSAFCRYDVTCSQYAKKAFQNHGLVKGLNLSIRRLLSCQPLTSFKSGG